ncbi:cobalamin B12-binding domain-containing protein [Kitasatospora sp. NPDC088346]|uniref:cobalamin B12-binding domain-containing protein n=1 Tax=Kitasatospora sp. NPDC088346 TaxID=3364073 RepID=UPI0037FAF2E5
MKTDLMHRQDLLSASAGSPLRIVVTSMASDSHMWNLVFLELLLEELGHRVVNLGPCVPDGEIVSACLRVRPDLVVVSSVNGHAHDEGRRVIAALRAVPELADVPAVIGGKLGVSGAGNRRHAAELVAAGFDAAFDDAGGEGIALFRSFLGALPAGAAA